MQFNPRKIHIYGASGSGKTTLARQLSRRLNIGCFDLDEIGYEGGAGAQRSLEIRLAEINLIATQESWITEGAFLGWTNDLFEKADVIVWLDLPWRIASFRILSRHLKAELRRNNRHPGWLKLYNFLKWCRKYYNNAGPVNKDIIGDIAENRNTTAHYLRQYQEKGRVVHCTRTTQVKDFLNSLSINRPV